MSSSHQLDNRKRCVAWISGLGTAFIQIFRILDEDDSTRYNNALEEVHNDQNKYVAIMKENILITTSVISSYNRTLNKSKLMKHETNKPTRNDSRS